MANRLQVYNAALRICGESRLATLNDNNEARRVMDEVWNDGLVDTCLRMGQWNFGTRTQRLEYDPDITPNFGYRYGFTKPTDWVRTTAFSADENFTRPWRDYRDESGVWYCNLETIYVGFVSNDAGYGADLSKWPADFTDFLETMMADAIVLRISKDKEKWKHVHETALIARKQAKSTDAMDQASTRQPAGSWTMARRGGRRGYGDDGGFRTGDLTE